MIGRTVLEALLVASLAYVFVAMILFFGNRRRPEPLVTVNDKCPACGHRNGKIAFDPQCRLIRHTCNVCTAEWGEPTVVEVKAWHMAAPPAPITKGSAVL